MVSLFSQYLSHLDHFRSLRPSTTLCVFNGFTLLFDLPRLRTLSFLPNNRIVTILFAVACGIKAGLVGLESIEKRPLLKKPFAGSSLEDTSGIFNRSLFLWVNPLLWKGSKTNLTVEDLPILTDEITSASNPTTLADRWNKGKTRILYNIEQSLRVLQPINMAQMRCYGSL